jgi:hypothetical protein
MKKSNKTLLQTGENGGFDFEIDILSIYVIIRNG